MVVFEQWDNVQWCFEIGVTVIGVEVFRIRTVFKIAIKISMNRNRTIAFEIGISIRKFIRNQSFKIRIRYSMLIGIGWFFELKLKIGINQLNRKLDFDQKRRN